MQLYNKATGKPIELIACDGDRTLITFNGSQYASTWDMLGHMHCNKTEWAKRATDYVMRIKAASDPKEQERLFDEWAAINARALKGFPVSRLDEIELPYSEGAKDMFSLLKGVEVKKAIVSGGIDIVYRRVMYELGFNYCVANVLPVDSEGKLTGDVQIVISHCNKKQRLDGIIETFQPGTTYDRMIAVGDNHNDVEMLQKAKNAGGLSFAIHPEDQRVVDAANFTIKNFMDILNHVEIR